MPVTKKSKKRKEQPSLICSQEAFYIIADQLWDKCQANLAQFEKANAMYNAAFVADAKKQVSDAKALKTSAQRSSPGKTTRGLLEISAEQCRKNWQMLKAYITGTFPVWDIEIKLLEAGSAHYNKAAHNNWSSLLSLITAGNTFIDTWKQDLTTTGHMPADFITRFRDESDKCTQLTSDFLSAEDKRSLETGDKAKANLEAFNQLRSMLKLGQLIFSNDKRLQEQFVYARAVAQVRGGSAGLRGKVTDITTGKPLSQTKVSSLSGKYTAVTDAEGRFHITRMAAGMYTFVFEHVHYTTLEHKMGIAAGVTSNLDLQLTEAVELLKVA